MNLQEGDYIHRLTIFTTPVFFIIFSVSFSSTICLITQPSKIKFAENSNREYKRFFIISVNDCFCLCRYNAIFQVNLDNACMAVARRTAIRTEVPISPSYQLCLIKSTIRSIFGYSSSSICLPSKSRSRHGAKKIITLKSLKEARKGIA